MIKNDDMQKKLDKLAKRYKNKKIIAYGTGTLASQLVDEYDLSKLNIIGFSNSSYFYYKEPFKNYETFSPDEIKDLKPDLILVTVAEFKYVKEFWKKKFPEFLKIKRELINPKYLLKKNITNKNELFPKNTNVKNSSLKEIVETISELEKELDLLNLSFCNIKIWQVSRFKIFLTLCSKLNISQQPYELTSSNFLKELINEINERKNACLYSPFRNAGKINALIYSSTERTEKGRLENVYIEHLVKELAEKNVPYHVIIGYSPKIYQISFSRNISTMDAFKSYFRDHEKLRIKETRSELTPEFIEKVKHIETRIFEIFGVKIELLKLFIDKSITFIEKYIYFKKLFKEKEVKELYIVCSYTNYEIIKAAKDLNITVIELQHGVMEKYLIGYYYPYSKNPEYLPDKFYSFGEYWSQNGSIPVDKENIVNYGFHCIRNAKKKYENTKKIENQILVLSQWTVRGGLLQLILDNIEKLQDYQIILKLHPREQHLINVDPYLLQLKNYPNIIISKNQPLYKLLASSNYVIGVYSTAIYEAIEFGCKPILADLPGIEYMENLKNTYKIPVLRQGSDNILDIINQANKINVNISSLF